MNIWVFGAGAIGGYIGCCLSKAGANVSLIARGPHKEAIGVAIVLKSGIDCNEIDIKNYASKHLADFKIPKYIRFLEEIPKGATGKLQRIGLAEKLGLE